MSNRFPAPCPSSKLITASHSWYGFAAFNFPGFKGTFSGQNFTGLPSDTGGSWASGVPTLALGDLVLSQINTLYGGTGYFVYKLTTLFESGWPAVDPQIDCVGSIYSYNNLVPAGAQYNGGANIANGATGSYTLTGLVAGLTYAYTLGIADTSVDGLTAGTGTFTAPGTSITLTFTNTSGFTLSSCNVGSIVQLAPATRHFTLWDYKVITSIANEEGPTSYPLIDTVTGSDYLNGYNREVWGTGLSGSVAYLQLEITNDLSGLAGASGAPGTDVITETWTVNPYTGTVTDSGPSPSPSSAEKSWMFPLPGHYDIGVYVDNIVPILISLTASATSLAFKMGYSIGGTLYTFTQTIALSTTNSLSDAITACTTLLSGHAGSQSAEFAAMTWGQQAACSYNSDGSVNVSISSIPSTASTPTLCSGSIPGGTTATAATGYGYNALTSGKNISMATAYIDVCGNYCLRTFHCTAATPVVDCASDNVDGYAPVTISVPTIPSGETQVWAYLFPNCQCT